METLIILVNIVGLILIVYWWRHSKSNKEKKNIKKLPASGNSKELKLENVEVGGVLNVKFVGEDLDVYDLIIIKKNGFQDSGGSWFQLIGESSKDTVSIEFEKENPSDISLLKRTLNIRELGVSMDDLYAMDEEERGSITFEGQMFSYDDSDEATFYPDCMDDKAQRLYYWDFESENGNQSITVERWENGDLKVNLYDHVEPRNVEVYSLMTSNDSLS